MILEVEMIIRNMAPKSRKSLFNQVLIDGLSKKQEVSLIFYTKNLK
jgi:hypothetical protein